MAFSLTLYSFQIYWFRGSTQVLREAADNFGYKLNKAIYVFHLVVVVTEFVTVITWAVLLFFSSMSQLNGDERQAKKIELWGYFIAQFGHFVVMMAILAQIIHNSQAKRIIKIPEVKERELTANEQRRKFLKEMIAHNEVSIKMRDDANGELETHDEEAPVQNSKRLMKFSKPSNDEEEMDVEEQEEMRQVLHIFLIERAKPVTVEPEYISFK